MKTMTSIVMKKDFYSTNRKLSADDQAEILSVVSKELAMGVLQARGMALEDRFEQFGVTIRAVQDALDSIEFEVAKNEFDPLKQFLASMDAISEVLRPGKFQVVLRRVLKTKEWSIPAGLDESDVRSRLLIAFHALVGEIQRAYTSMATLLGMSVPAPVRLN